MPAVSVIMLTYNRKELAANMVRDILTQTLRDLEFIIVDNGSDDGTAELLERLVGQDARVSVLRLPRSSIGCGRNAGVRKATGRYVTFVDDDDRVDGDFLEFLFALTDNERHDAALCGTDESLDGLTYTPQCVFDEQMEIEPEEAVRLLLERRKIRAGMPGKLIRLAILRKHAFRENCAHEDIFTTYKYLAENRSLALRGMPKYHILRNGKNDSFFTTDHSLWTPAKLEEYLVAFCERTHWISERFPDLAAFARYTEWSYMLSMLDKIFTYHLKNCAEQEWHMRRELSAHHAELSAAPWLKDFERDWLQRFGLLQDSLFHRQYVCR